MKANLYFLGLAFLALTLLTLSLFGYGGISADNRERDSAAETMRPRAVEQPSAERGESAAAAEQEAHDDCNPAHGLLLKYHFDPPPVPERLQ